MWTTVITVWLGFNVWLVFMLWLRSEGIAKQQEERAARQRRGHRPFSGSTATTGARDGCSSASRSVNESGAQGCPPSGGGCAAAQAVATRPNALSRA